MKRNTKIMIGALIAFAVVIALIIVLNTGTRSNDPSIEHGIVYFEREEDETKHFLADDKRLEGYIAGDIDSYTTVDGTVAAIIAGTGLYRVDNEGILKIYPAAVGNVVLSLDGNFMLFSTVTQAFIYNYQTDEQIEITGFEAEKVLSLAISPNAKAFAVSILDKDNKSMTYSYMNGETRLLREDSCIAAISDDGNNGYYVEAGGIELTGKLYYIDGDEDSLIAENVEANFEINKDLTEITFDIEENTWFSENGGKAKKLIEASVITAAGECKSVMGGEYCTVSLKNAESIFDCIYYTIYTVEDADTNKSYAYDVYYINSSHHVTKLVGGASQFEIGEDGTTIACLVDNDVYRVSAYNPKKPEIIQTNVVAFACSKDLKRFYIVDMYANLKYLASGAKAKQIMSNIYYIAMTKDGVCLCLSDYENEKGMLSWIHEGESGIIADGIYSVEALAGVTVYYTNQDAEKEGVFDVYISDNSIDFKLEIERVQLNKIGN